MGEQGPRELLIDSKHNLSGDRHSASGSALEREKEFFSDYYAGSKVNPRVNRMRLRRHCAVILKHCSSPKPARVLSVGCGAGELERMLAPSVGRVIGVDLSRVAIEQAQQLADIRQVSNVEYRCGNALELNDVEPFDLIVCAAFLHHVPEQRLSEFLAKLTGMLKPGGWFYSQDPNIHGAMRWLGRKLLGGRYHRYHSPDERELDPRALAQTARDCCLERIKIQGFDVALVPLSYIFPRIPHWFFYPVLWFDYTWCATGLQRWASGFYLIAQKSGISNEQSTDSV